MTKSDYDEITPALQRYQRAFAPLLLDPDLRTSFHRIPLDADARRALYLMGSVERDSKYQFENAIAARLTSSQDIATFLPLWADEEAHHGNILLQIAKATGDREEGYDTRRSQRPTFAQRTSSVRSRMAGRFLPDLRAAYGVFGAYQEHSVIIAYGLLAKRVGDGRLAAVLADIVGQERRHLAVYRAIAKTELARSRRARIIARCSMWLLWKPVGYEAMGYHNWQWLLAYLCPTEAERERLCRSDDALRGLLGFEDVAPMVRFLARSVVSTSSRTE